VAAWYADAVSSAAPEIEGDLFGESEDELTQAIPAVYDLRSRFTGRRTALAALDTMLATMLGGSAARLRRADRTAGGSARAGWWSSWRASPASAIPRSGS
jgi:hypothetical protein